MTEIWTGPSQPDFGQTFAMMTDLVQDPTKHLHVKQSNNSETNRQPFGWVTPIFDVIEQDYILDPETNLPLKDARTQVTCRRWFTSDPTEVEETTMTELEQRGVVGDRGAAANWAILPGNSQDSKCWLGEAFMRFAPNERELGKVLAQMFLMEANVPGEHRGGRMTNTTHNVLVKSLDYVGDPATGQAFIEPVVQALELLPAETQEKVKTWISNGLIKLLLGTPIGRYDAEMVRQFPQEAIVGAVELYNTAGLVKDSFWQSAALFTGVAAKVPAFLPLLHAKLSGPDGERLIASLESPTHVARDYIHAVLRHYAEDPTRNSKTAQGILQRIRPRKKNQGHTIDLEALVREANALGDSYNAIIDQRQGAESEKYEMLPPVLDDDVAFLGDAFLRLASIMRRQDTSEAIRGAQLDQDVMHADIISILLADLPASTRISEADLRVRFPEMSPERRRALRQRLLKVGLPLGEAVERPELE